MRVQQAVDPLEREPLSVVQRLVRGVGHLAEAQASAGSAVAAAVSGLAPAVAQPAVPVASDVLQWSGSVARGGLWYATAIRRSAGWTILRSPDGLAWEDIGLPVGYPWGVMPAVGVGSGGVVFVAHSGRSQGNQSPVTVFRYDAGAWVNSGGGNCYNPSTIAESVSQVLVSVNYVAVITTRRRCVVSSVNSGSSWSYGKSLSSATAAFLQGSTLHSYDCGAGGGSWATILGYGRFDLETYQSYGGQQSVPLVGCNSPTFLNLGGGAVAVASLKKANLLGDYGRAYIISVSADSGATWTVLAVNEPLPYKFIEGVDTSGSTRPHTDSIWFGYSNGQLLVRDSAPVSGTTVTRLDRTLDLSAGIEEAQYQSPLDPGQWQSGISRYNYAIAGSQTVLAPPVSAEQSSAIDGLTLSGTTLYAVTGQASPVAAGAAQPVARTAAEVAHVSVNGPSGSATSQSGYWTVYLAAPVSGSTHVYRTAPDGRVDDLGVAPPNRTGIQLYVSDLGHVFMLTDHGNTASPTCACDRTATSYWFFDQWYGPAPVRYRGYGAMTGTEAFSPAVPQLHVASGYTGYEQISPDFGMTWVEQTSWTVANTTTAGATLVLPYQYYLAGSYVVRRHVGDGSVARVTMPAGLTAVKVTVRPGATPTPVVVARASSGAITLLQVNEDMTLESLQSGVVPPVSSPDVAYGPDGRLYAFKTSQCTAGTFVNRWALDTATSSFAEPQNLWWGPSGTVSGVQIPDRPSGTVDEWQTLVTGAASTLVMPTALAGTLTGFGTGGYGSLAGNVNVSLGNFTWQSNDLAIPSVGPGLDLTRTFNGLNPRVGMFGQGWSSTYETRVAVNCGTGAVTVVYPDGRNEVHTPVPSGGFAAPPGATTRLTTLGSGYRLTFRDGTAFEFSSSGLLSKIVNALGHALNLTWLFGKLASVVDGVSGRSLTFVYTGSVVTEVRTTPVTAGGVTAPITVRYGYVGSTLERVCGPIDPSLITGTCTLYTMTAGRLEAVIDANGHVDAAVEYDGQGRVVAQEDGAGGRTTFTYPSPLQSVQTDPTGRIRTVESDSMRRQRLVTDAVGNVTEYRYDPLGFPEATVLPSGRTQSVTRDAHGNVLTSTDAGGGTRYFVYDAFDNPVREVDERGADANDLTFAITMQWDGAHHLLLSATRPPTQDVPISTVTRTYTAGTESAVGGGVMPAFLLRAETSALGGVTTYDYDSKGNVRRMVDPVGLTVEYEYDELGRLVSITEISDSFPAGVIRDVEYDALGHVIAETGPGVINPVTCDTHRQLAEYAFDGAGNMIAATLSDIGGSSSPDATRQVVFEYDNADRRISSAVAGSGETATEYDPAGRVVATVDELGRRTVTEYNGVGLPSREYAAADPILGPSVDTTLWQRTYDEDSRVAAETDARGVVTTSEYDAAGRLASVTVTDFHEPGGGTRALVVGEYSYDAAGHLLQQITGGGLRTETFAYDEAGRLLQHTLDPAGLGRATTFVYDAGDNVLMTVWADGTRTETLSATYDVAGRQVSATLENGDDDLTTTYVYDQRGMRTAVVDARGNAPGANPSDFRTTSQFDELKRLSVLLSPEAVTYANGLSASTQASALTYGYNTFGDQTEARDPRGGVLRQLFDQVGQLVQTHYPAYVTPAGPTLEPFDVSVYDLAGQLISTTDRRGATTSYSYDYAGRLLTVVGPAVAAGQSTTTYEYDAAGNRTASTDPTGARHEYVYDDLNRLQAESTIERFTAGGPVAMTWLYGFDDLGNLTSTVSPEGRTTVRTYNAASELVQAIDGEGQSRSFTYDLAGRLVASVDPLGRQTRTSYDLAGRPVAVSTLDAAETVLAVEQRSFDEVGNVTAVTRPEGAATPGVPNDYVTYRSYDALNRLVSVSQPVTPSATVSTQYRYDAAGNRTAVVDGNGSITVSTYTPWNQVESVVEPATSAFPGAVDRTWTTTYDAGGLAVATQEPGGYSRVSTFDANRRLVAVVATDGIDVGSTGYEYDLGGRVTSVSAPSGAISIAYDDRGLPTAVLDPSLVPTAYSYDDDGLLIQRTDGGGSATFQWDDRGLLQSMSDPVASATLAYSYDNAGQLSQVDTSDGTTYHYQWDDFGRLVSESISRTGVLASRAYTYDLNGQLTSQSITAPGNSQAGTHTYAYDWLGRLTQWVQPSSATVDYQWDAAGNRIGAGAVQYTYDERNRLVSSTDGTSYEYDARGDLTQASNGQSVHTFAYDPLGRMADSDGRQIVSDGLGRVISIGAEELSYSGLGADPVTVGAWTLGRTPFGVLVSASDGSSTDWVVPDRHGDVSIGLAVGSGSIDFTRVFDPFGAVIATSGSTGIPVGFQGDVTDSVTGDVWMGARWFAPSVGSFRTRDSWAGDAAEPGTLNRYAYGLADPLGMWDPTGHSAEDVGVGVDAALQEFNRHHDEEVAKRRARGDASVASGVSTLAGPVSLITAVNSPDTSWIGTLKVVGSVVVATAATVGCTAAGAGALAGACGGAAARFFDGLVSGQGVWDLVKYTFDPKSIAIDIAVGLVSAGVARIAGSGAQLASREMTVVLASAGAAGATGAVADATAVLLAGGTWSQAWAAATDWQSRLIDFGTGAVMGMREVGERRSSQGNAERTSLQSHTDQSTRGTPATELAEGPVDRLLYGGRPGKGLPGRAGVDIPNRPTITELENLTEKHGVEFATTYKLGPGPNGAGGQYRMFSGDATSVGIPIEPDSMLIYHTHPGGTPWASGADRAVMDALEAVGSPQRTSCLIPVGMGCAIPFKGNT